MGTYIVVGILIIIVVAALLGSKKHLKGEGGCCGGGGDAPCRIKVADKAEAFRQHRSNQEASYRRNVLRKLPEPH